MATFVTDIDGKVTEISEKTPEKGGNSERDPREMPDLEIVEIVQVPQKGNDIPPWMIQNILEIINGNRKEIEKKLPN